MPKQKLPAFIGFAQLAPALASSSSYCSRVAHTFLHTLFTSTTIQPFPHALYIYSSLLKPLSLTTFINSLILSLSLFLNMGFSSNGFSMFVLVGIVVSSFLVATCAGNFYQDFDITWGDNRAKIFKAGQLLSLSLDRVSGSGFQSKKEYLFGRIDMQLKLVAGNSAGTVTAYYVCIKTHSLVVTFFFA